MSVASLLRDRVTIQYQSVSEDGYGGQVVSWVELATVFAQVESLFSGGDSIVGNQRNANSAYRVSVRVRTDVDASMRILWKTHTLTIHSLHEQGEILSILTYEEHQ